MSVTRKQVANRAAVSEATVSYVVNNGPRPVAPETRARVIQAIQELGYHPSDVARSLRRQRTSTIGLVVPDTANPFYGEIARIIENVGYANGFTVILCNSNLDIEREAGYINMLRTRRAEGVVIIPTRAEAVAQLLDAKIHTVVLEYEIDGAHCLVADDFHGGWLVTEHLLRLGHQRIGCIARAADKTSSQNRIAGYRAALGSAGLAADEHLIVETEPEIAAGETAAFCLLDLRDDAPTAIFAHNDSMALGVLSAIRKRKLRVPDDVSVVGFDDIVEAAYTNPPLTTVAYPKQAIGEQAARLLIDLMQGKAIQPHTAVIDVDLIERESSASPLASRERQT
jgi:LacI family transcriptional regulator